ncbi:unnamed protein product, partial [Iphiclides podalirius]
MELLLVLFLISLAASRPVPSPESGCVIMGDIRVCEINEGDGPPETLNQIPTPKNGCVTMAGIDICQIKHDGSRGASKKLRRLRNKDSAINLIPGYVPYNRNRKQRKCETSKCLRPETDEYMLTIGESDFGSMWK